jgi:DNA-binding CsgD family transcriptional regulator
VLGSPKSGMNESKQLNAVALLRLLSAVPLTERQRQVLDLRSQGLSCAAVGRHLQISGERVRQIEARLRTMARRMSQQTSC